MFANVADRSMMGKHLLLYIKYNEVVYILSTFCTTSQEKKLSDASTYDDTPPDPQSLRLSDFWSINFFETR